MDGNKNSQGFKIPFYEPPPRKTSADIINEARLAIRELQMAHNSYASTTIKPLQTKRPFTPKDKERLLFSNKNKNAPINSTSVISEIDFTIPPSTPEETLFSSNAIRRRLDINKQRSNSVVDLNNATKIRLPHLDSIKPITKLNSSQRGAFFLENLPEEKEEIKNGRIIFSSPQERTEYNQTLDRENAKIQQNLSKSVLLEPQNLYKIFEKKHNLLEGPKYLFNAKDYPNKKQEISLQSILSMLNEGKHTEDIQIDLLNNLYKCLESENTNNRKISSGIRMNVLKCLYKYVDSKNETILLSLARIILYLRVTGGNLTGVCKLIFKVSKNDRNDHLFFNKNLLELFIDALGRCSPIDDSEACIYAYGSIKFLTMNTKLLEKILSLGILPLMVLHIKLLNNAKLEKIQIPDHSSHALFQLTGALRNIASDQDIYANFVASQAVPELCQALNLFAAEMDIVANIARILSTISTNESCCDEITNNKHIFGTFIELFDRYPGNEEIIVRLAYTLGNIVANLDYSRIQFYNEDKSISSLLKLWRIYLERTLKKCALILDEDVNDFNNAEDVMIKIVRVIANMAINPEIGKLITDNYGWQLIDEFLKVLISNPFKKNDELVFSVLSTLNNLSFYYTDDYDDQVINKKQIEIVEATSEYINVAFKDNAIESMRILGNLSRSSASRAFISDSNIFNLIIMKLGSSDINMLKTTIGVFVNLMTDNYCRNLLQQKDGISKLIDILNNYGQYDWTFSMLICQVIWNYCIDNVNLYEILSDSEIQQLIAILVDYLDEERIFGITESSENIDTLITDEYLVWEEFALVGTNLLEKIDKFLDTVDAEKEINRQILKKSNNLKNNISFTAW